MTTNKQRAAQAAADSADKAQVAADAAQETAEVAQEAARAPEGGTGTDLVSAEKKPAPEMVPAPNGSADDHPEAMLPEQFEAGRLYDVQLLKPITIGNRTLAPGAAQTMTAELCQSNRASLWRAVLNDSGVQEAR